MSRNAPKVYSLSFMNFSIILNDSCSALVIDLPLRYASSDLHSSSIFVCSFICSLTNFWNVLSRNDWSKILFDVLLGFPALGLNTILTNFQLSGTCPWHLCKTSISGSTISFRAFYSMIGMIWTHLFLRFEGSHHPRNLVLNNYPFHQSHISGFLYLSLSMSLPVFGCFICVLQG